MKNTMKLVKYDLLKEKTILLCGMSATAANELLYILGAFFKNNDMRALSSMMFYIITFVLCVLVFVFSFNIFNIDISKKEGYLPFLAPVNSREIVRSKLLSTLLVIMSSASLLLLYAIFNCIICRILSIEKCIPDFSLDSIYIFEENNIMTCVVTAIRVLIKYFSFILSIYLAVTIACTLRIHGKFGNAVAFLIWLLLNSFSRIIIFADKIIFKNNHILRTDTLDMVFGVGGTKGYAFGLTALISILVDLIWAYLLYRITCRLIEKNLSI